MQLTGRALGFEGIYGVDQAPDGVQPPRLVINMVLDELQPADIAGESSTVRVGEHNERR